MSWASARSSRAMPPQSTAKRALAIRAARSVSSPIAAPTSSWGLAGKSNVRGSLQRRTSTLSSSPLPSGTDGCGRFGSCSPSVLTPALGQADGLRGLVAEGLEVLALADEPAALGIELDQLGDEIRAPLRGQRAADRIGLLADQPDVKHDATGLRPARCSPSRRAPPSRRGRRRRGR